jgi:hypothetical protein
MPDPNSEDYSSLDTAAMLMKLNAARLAGSPEFRKRFVRSLPLIGDIANFESYLRDPSEPSLEQRVRNAVLIGGGGALASVLTGGWDALPALLQAFGEAGEAANLKKTPINPVFEAAPVVNVENYLQEYAYSMDPNREIPESKDSLRRFKKIFTDDLPELEGIVEDYKRIYGGN